MKITENSRYVKYDKLSPSCLNLFFKAKLTEHSRYLPMISCLRVAFNLFFQNEAKCKALIGFEKEVNEATRIRPIANITLV